MVNKIYLAKIYFTDLSSYKIRPILVIKEIDNVKALEIYDIFCNSLGCGK